MRIPNHSARRCRRVLALAAAGGLALVVAACGGDDDGSADAATTTGPGADLAAYCADEVALDRIFGSADPEEPAAFQMAIDSAGPIVERLVAGAPADLAEHFEVLRGAYEDVVATGDPSAFFSDEVATADDAVHAYDLEHCGWQTFNIAAGDYHFSGDFPATAGAVNLEVTNTGAEPHLLVVVRKHDDVTAPAVDVFSGLETHEEMLESFDEVATVFVDPGASDYALADIDSGEYVAFCPVPVGSGAEGEGDGPPHFTMGMMTAFDVS